MPPAHQAEVPRPLPDSHRTFTEPAAAPSPPSMISSIVEELSSTQCRLTRLGLRRRRRGEVDAEDHGVLMAEYRRRTQAQGVREESSLAHSRAHVCVHRSRGAPRNAGRAPRAGREACPAAAKREPRPQRVARSRRGLTSHGCIRRRLGTANLRACRPAPQPAQTMRWTRLRLLTAWEALQGRRRANLP